MVVYARHANGKSRLAVWKEQARAVPITSKGVLRTKNDDSIFRIDRLEFL